MPRADPKKAEPGRGGGDRNRRHLALRRAWNDEHVSAAGPSSVRKRKYALSKAAGPAVDQYRQWFTNDDLPPLMTKCPLAEIRRATDGGVLTGRGADIILIDDPLKPDEALSDTQRRACNEWFDHTLYSRLNDKPRGTIVLIMHRLHESLPSG